MSFRFGAFIQLHTYESQAQVGGCMPALLHSLRSLLKPTMDNETKPTYLIIGLGNPGRQYVKSRHNVGFRLLDRLAERLGVTFSRMESKALVTHADYQGCRLILAKPQTFMNLSGQAVASLARFYKISTENMIVAYDDVDLPLGVLRIRPQGGSAGHKGMTSIIERLGMNMFPRLRLGVDRPPGRMDAAAYVLQDFTPAEEELLATILESGVDAILVFVSQGLEVAMNQFNGTI
jgi:PTH1 family peptidyl-tRNA hydrolase